MMTSLELSPSPPLRPYVRLLWCLELDTPAAFGPPERIAPDGIVELVFHYRAPMAVRFARERVALQPLSSLVSQTRRFIEIQPRGPTGLISVRFHPWGAYHFFAPPVSELADRTTSAEDVWGRSVRELEERLASSTGVSQRAALVERFLLRQLERHRKRDVQHLVRELWKRKGHVRVDRLSRELGVTERSLQRLFRDALGMPPKGFARLTRFLHSCAVLRRGDWTSLTEVGHDCRYYDQAHFISDFRAFTGMTPSAFVHAPSVSFLDID